MLSFDLQISQYFFSLGRELPVIFVRFMATDLFWVLLAFVLIVSWLARGGGRPRHPRLFLQAAAAAAMALAVNAVIGWLYFRHRPFVDLAFRPLVDVAPLGKSFPSDHAAAAWALASTVWLKQKKSGSLALLLALFIALGRVLAGVHYFSDVIVGAALGFGLAYLGNLFSGRWRALDKF